MLVTCARIVWEVGPSLRENMGKNILDNTMISLVILLRVPSEDSFKWSASRVDSNLSLSGKKPTSSEENSHGVRNISRGYWGGSGFSRRICDCSSSSYARWPTFHLMDHARCFVRPREKYFAGLRTIGNLSVNNSRQGLQFKEPLQFEYISSVRAKRVGRNATNF
jgi:hypothetical protein